MKELIGQQLGPYRILDLLGEGQSGYTFRAAHGPQMVAVKVLRPELTTGNGFRGEFTEHAQALTSDALKHHPHIVETYHFGFGEQSGVPYIVTELVTGGALNAHTFVKAGTDRNAEFLEGVNLIKQVAEALAVIHGEGLVHGNIKPANILVTQTGPAADPSAKLSDIGLTRLVTKVRRPDSVVSDSPYISPEQRGGTWSDERSDIYSLGAVLYELTTRHSFHQAQATVPGTSQSQIVPPSQWLLQFPKDLEEMILRCLKPTWTDRFWSATELANSLNEFLEKNRPPTPPKPLDEYPDEPSPLQTAAPTIQVFYGRNTLIDTQAIGGAGVSIGSAPGNSIVLSAAEGVSPKHVMIEWDAHQVSVTDLGSRTGTRLKRQVLHPQFPATWQAKQWLKVGNYWIWLHPPGVINPIDKVEVLMDENGKSLTLTPGVAATCQVTIVNQRPHVDHFRLSVDGIPSTWIVDGTSREVELKANGGRKVIPLVVKIPKDSSARAGEYPVQIVAGSKAYAAVNQAYARAMWTVLPFDSVSMMVTPQKVSGRRVARFTVNLRQDGTGERTYSLSASGDDDEKQLDFAFSPSKDVEEAQLRVQLNPASAKSVKLKLTAPRKWAGTTTKCGITVQAQADDGTVLTKEARFLHRAIFPPWMLAIAPVVLLAIGLFIVYQCRPQDPNVWTTPPQEQLIQGRPFVVHWDGKTANRIIVRVDGQDMPNPGIVDEYQHPGTTEKTVNVYVQGENFFGKSPARTVSFRLQPPPPNPPAVIESFTADPPSIVKRGSVLLSWKIRDGAKAKLEPNIGFVNPAGGSQPTFPLDATQVFKLIAYNKDGNETDEKSVTVSVVTAEARIISFFAYDVKNGKSGLEHTLNQGEYLEFRYETENANAMRIQAVSELQLNAPSGRHLATFQGTGSYTLTLVITDQAGLEEKSKPVVVNVGCTFAQKITKVVGKGCNNKPQIKWQ
jgi:serine/threonine protein kinase